MLMSRNFLAALLLLVVLVVIDSIPSVEAKKKKLSIGKKKHHKKKKDNSPKMTTAVFTLTSSLPPTVTYMQTVQQVTVPQGLYTLDEEGCFCSMKITTAA